MLGMSVALVATHFKLDTIPQVASRGYIHSKIKHERVPVDCKYGKNSPIWHWL